MLNFTHLTSIETYIIKSRTILEEDISSTILDYYTEGYRDSMNANLVNSDCCRVELITTLEEFVYVIGYKIGTFDYKIGHCNDCNVVFSDEYKKTIKMTLMAFNIDDSINVFNEWLMRV